MSPFPYVGQGEGADTSENRPGWVSAGGVLLPGSGPARRPTHLINDHTRNAMVVPLRAQGHCTRPPLPVWVPHRPLGSVVLLVYRKGLWELESRYAALRSHGGLLGNSGPVRRKALWEM